MRRLALALALLTGCASALPDATPPQYASIPRYEKGGPITPPLRLQGADPAVRAFGPSGRATVEAVIDENGNVVDAWYVSGVRGLADAFIAALRQSRFAPATLNGKPIAVRIQIISTTTRSGF